MTLISESINTINKKTESYKETIKKLKELELTQAKLNSNFKEIISVLEMLIPEHNRYSCGDSALNNYGNCDRCTILQMKADGIWDDNYTVNISLDKILWRNKYAKR